jgi:hypothetical protein
VLAVDVGEHVAADAQLGEDHRRAVEPGLRATTAFDHPTQHHAALLGIELLIGKPGSQRAVGGQVELGDDLGQTWPVRTTPASALPPRASPRASRRIDLPAPVSPVKGTETGGELEFEPIDDDEIANGKMAQHEKNE